MAFRASPQHSSSKLGSAFGLRLNSDLSGCYQIAAADFDNPFWYFCIRPPYLPSAMLWAFVRIASIH